MTVKKIFAYNFAQIVKFIYKSRKMLSIGETKVVFFETSWRVESNARGPRAVGRVCQTIVKECKGVQPLAGGTVALGRTKVQRGREEV